MPLVLRKITGHPQARNAYRVIYRPVDAATPEIEVGSIGLTSSAHQRQFWAWGIDSVIERQPYKTSGEAVDREDAMAQFKAVWDVFASDPQRLAAFIDIKVRSRRS